MSIAQTETPQVAEASRAELGNNVKHIKPSFFRRLRLWAKRIAVAVSTFSATVVAGVVLLALFHAVWDRGLTIQPLAVPKALADAGFSSEVAALRLRDAVNGLYSQAKTTMHLQPIVDQRDGPDLVIPNVGVSIQTLATQLSTFLRLKRRTSVSGEFTAADGHLLLRIRLDGRQVMSVIEPGELQKPDVLLARAARIVLEVTQPYILAAALSGSEKNDAIRILDHIVSGLPKQDEQVKYAYSLRGLMYNDSGDKTKALIQYNKALGIDSKFAVAHNNIAAVYFEEGKISEAIAEFREATRDKPPMAQAHCNLGKALMRLGKSVEAKSEFLNAIETDFNYAPAHDDIGLFFESSGQNDDAVAEYKAAIEADAKYSWAYHHLGHNLKKAGLVEEAIAMHRLGLEADPKSSYGHQLLGDALRDGGRPDEAVKEYRAAADLPPPNTALRRKLGAFLASMGRNNEAIVEYQKATDADPKFALAHRELADVLRSADRDKDAISEYRKAIELDPNDSLAMRNLGMILSNSGETAGLHSGDAKP